jgi:hypothetical protein
MTRFAARARLPLFSSVNGQALANLFVARTWRVAGPCSVLWLLMAGALGVAQTANPAIRAEFRTAPRPLITRAIDRARTAPTAGAVNREAATALDLGRRDRAAVMEHMQLVLQQPVRRPMEQGLLTCLRRML